MPTKTNGTGGEILTAEHAANYLSISKRTVMDLLRSGKLPGRKVGGQWRLSHKGLEEYVRRHLPDSAPKQHTPAQLPPSIICPKRFDMAKTLVAAYAGRGGYPSDPARWAWHITVLANELVGHLEKLAANELDAPAVGDSWGTLKDA